MLPESYIFSTIAFGYVYLFMTELFIYRKCNLIHETAVAIIIGTIFGAVIYVVNPSLFQGPKFDEIFRNIIILILLPPMIFQDGYNVPKRKFFQNIFYINLYGVLGTILNLMTIFGIIYAFNANVGLITLVWQNQVIYLSNWQIAIFASCFCSIDTVVPQKIVNPERYPKLFSIIFGESIMKDTITFTLVTSIIHVYNTQDQNGQVNDALAIGSILLYFLMVIGGSILIGIGSAVFTTLLFKHFRFLVSEKGIAEMGMTILTGYASYILGQWSGCSGVISMLFCGITLSHFNVYNLTPQGKSSAKISVSTLALLAEGILFFLLGAYIFNIQIAQINNSDTDTTSVYYSFSWVFLLIGIGSLLIARLINVYLASLIGYMVMGKKRWRLHYYEYQILFVSGLVKGAVPFALILTTPLTEGSTSSLGTLAMQNTVIIIVFITSLFFNSVMPKIIRTRLVKINQLMLKNKDNPLFFDSMLINHRKQDINRGIYRSEKDTHSIQQSNKVDKNKSIQQEEAASIEMAKHFYKKIKSGTQKYWRKFEQGCLKPHLIYNYKSRKAQIKQMKKEQRKKECEQFWERFNEGKSLTEYEKEQNILIDQSLIDDQEQNILENFAKNKKEFEMVENDEFQANEASEKVRHRTQKQNSVREQFLSDNFRPKTYKSSFQ